jgi:hypothetical protein
MDTDALHSALLSITIVSEKLRNGRDTIGQVEELPPHLRELLDEAVSDLRMAKATLAGELGLDVCPRCWAELLTIDRNGHLSCPVCGEVSLERNEVALEQVA